MMKFVFNENSPKWQNIKDVRDWVKSFDSSSKPQIRSESVCSNQFNCYACVRHQIEANDALVMPL